MTFWSSGAYLHHPLTCVWGSNYPFTSFPLSPLVNNLNFFWGVWFTMKYFLTWAVWLDGASTRSDFRFTRTSGVFEFSKFRILTVDGGLMTSKFNFQSRIYDKALVQLNHETPWKSRTRKKNKHVLPEWNAGRAGRDPFRVITWSHIAETWAERWRFHFWLM